MALGAAVPATFNADADASGANADSDRTDAEANADGADAEAADANGRHTEPDHLQMVVGAA